MNTSIKQFQEEITNILNKDEYFANHSIEWLSEDALDIAYELKKNLNQTGIAAVVVTPSLEYQGEKEVAINEANYSGIFNVTSCDITFSTTLGEVNIKKLSQSAYLISADFLPSTDGEDGFVVVGSGSTYGRTETVNGYRYLVQFVLDSTNYIPISFVAEITPVTQVLIDQNNRNITYNHLNKALSGGCLDSQIQLSDDLTYSETSSTSSTSTETTTSATIVTTTDITTTTKAAVLSGYYLDVNATKTTTTTTTTDTTTTALEHFVVNQDGQDTVSADIFPTGITCEKNSTYTANGISASVTDDGNTLSATCTIDKNVYNKPYKKKLDYVRIFGDWDVKTDIEIDPTQQVFEIEIIIFGDDDELDYHPNCCTNESTSVWRVQPYGLNYRGVSIQVTSSIGYTSNGPIVKCKPFNTYQRTTTSSWRNSVVRNAWQDVVAFPLRFSTGYAFLPYTDTPESTTENWQFLYYQKGDKITALNNNYASNSSNIASLSNAIGYHVRLFTNSTMTFCSYKIIDLSGNILHNIIPVINANDKAQLYDTISEEYVGDEYNNFDIIDTTTYAIDEDIVTTSISETYREISTTTTTTFDYSTAAALTNTSKSTDYKFSESSINIDKAFDVEIVLQIIENPTVNRTRTNTDAITALDAAHHAAYTLAGYYTGNFNNFNLASIEQSTVAGSNNKLLQTQTTLHANVIL